MMQCHKKARLQRAKQHMYYPVEWIDALFPREKKNGIWIIQMASRGIDVT